MTHKGWYSPEDLEVLKRHGEVQLQQRMSKVEPIADKAEIEQRESPSAERFTSFSEGMSARKRAEILDALKREVAS